MERPLGDTNNHELDAWKRPRGWASHGPFMDSFRAVEAFGCAYDWIGFSPYFNRCARNADLVSLSKMAVVQLA